MRSITKAPAKNIAVLTDFSPCSSSALEHAIRLAKFSDAKILLIHAIEPWTFAYFPGEADMEEQLCDRARWNMLREEEKLSNVRHQVIVQQGTPWDVLRMSLASEHIDLVVLGTVGTVGFHNDEVMGSTAQQVIRQAPCPVLSVGSEIAVSESFPNISHILLPTDLAGAAHSAVAYAASLAELHRAHLALMHVVPAQTLPEPAEAERIKAPYRRRLSDVVRGSVPLAYAPDCLVELAGNPADAILKAARELPADLIVMGRIQRSKASTNGRVHNSLRILVQAPCPVLTIPEKDGVEIDNSVRPQPEAFYLGLPEALRPSGCAL